MQPSTRTLILPVLITLLLAATFSCGRRGGDAVPEPPSFWKIGHQVDEFGDTTATPFIFLADTVSGHFSHMNKPSFLNYKSDLNVLKEADDATLEIFVFAPGNPYVKFIIDSKGAEFETSFFNDGNFTLKVSTGEGEEREDISLRQQSSRAAEGALILYLDASSDEAFINMLKKEQPFTFKGFCKEYSFDSSFEFEAGPLHGFGKAFDQFRSAAKN